MPILPTEVLFNLTIPVIVLIGLLLIILSIIKIFSKSATPYHTQAEEKSDGAYEQALSIQGSAYRKAQDLLGKAELDSVKIVADTKVINRKYQEKYEAELAQMGSEMLKNFDLRLDRIEADFTKHLNDLYLSGAQNLSSSQLQTQTRTNQMFEKFEAGLATFLTSSQQRSSQAIDLEIKAARQLIDTYKAQQLQIIDENIVTILERTLSLVITQKLPLKDHMDLIYEALEKAKTEKFIV